jgi:hypothetical protein
VAFIISSCNLEDWSTLTQLTGKTHILKFKHLHYKLKFSIQSLLLSILYLPIHTNFRVCCVSPFLFKNKATGNHEEARTNENGKVRLPYSFSDSRSFLLYFMIKTIIPFLLIVMKICFIIFQGSVFIKEWYSKGFYKSKVCLLIF